MSVSKSRAAATLRRRRQKVPGAPRNARSKRRPQGLPAGPHIRADLIIPFQCVALPSDNGRRSGLRCDQPRCVYAPDLMAEGRWLVAQRKLTAEGAPTSRPGVDLQSRTFVKFVTWRHMVATYTLCEICVLSTVSKYRTRRMQLGINRYIHIDKPPEGQTSGRERRG